MERTDARTRGRTDARTHVKRIPKTLPHLVILVFLMAPNPAIGQGIQVDCDQKPCGGLCYTFTSPYSSKFFQVWDFGDGTTVSCYCPVVEHCYTNVNTYSGFNGSTTVTLTVPNIAQLTTSLYHANCQQGVFIGNTDGSVSSLTAFTALPGNSFSGVGLLTNKVYVYGIVNVDKFFTFSGAAISVSSGGGFNVPQDEMLQLDQKTNVDVLSTCPCMWRGINVMGLLVGSKAGLTNALYAVRVFTNATVRLNQVAFNNDYIGLYGDGNLVIPNNATSFAGNRFATNAGLKDWCNPEVVSNPFEPSGGTFAQDVGWAGVYLREANTFRVPASTTAINLFSDLANGFYMVNSNAQATVLGLPHPGIRSCQFTNMLRGGYPANIGGHGIYFRDTEGGHALFQMGLGMLNTTTLTFDNCEVGVFAEAINNASGSTVRLMQNNMTGVETGVRLESITGDISSVVSSNRIRTDTDHTHDPAGSAGVWIEDRNTIQTSHIVEENNIFVNHPGAKPAFGVLVRGNYDMNANPTANNVSVRYNPIINLEVGRSCIHVSQYSGVDVINNSMTAQTPSGNAMYGIAMFGGAFNDAHCNTASGPVATLNNGNAWDAMRYDGTIDPTITDNNSINFQRGVTFENNCGMATELRCNHLQGTQLIGLLYMTNANTGIQPDYGNTWQGTYLQNGASYASNFHLPGNRYWARPNATPSEFPPNPNPNAGWFIPSGVIPQCPAFLNCDAQVGEQELNDGDYLIANGGITGPSGQVWSSEKYLYNKLVSNPDLIDNNPIMQDFVADREDAPIGLFQDLADGIRSLHVLDAGSLATLQANQAAILSALEQIQAIDGQLPDDPSDVQYAALMQQREALLDDMASKQQQNAGIIAAKHTAKVQTANVLLAANAAIPALAQYEINEQQFLDVYLNTIGKDNTDATSTQLATIDAITQQCPAEGGRSVYWAIGLLGHLTGIALEPEECGAGGRESRGQSQAIGSLLVFPNPTSGMASVSYTFHGMENSKILVSNHLGSILREYRITEQSGNLQLDDLPSGVYFIQLVENGQLLRTEKLIKF